MADLTKLKSMALTPEEAKEREPWKFDDKGQLRSGEKLSKFPDGLELRMDGTILKKLGMKIGDFHLGDAMTISANVTVEKVFHEEVLGDDPEIMVKLQVTGLALGDVEASLEDLVFKS